MNWEEDPYGGAWHTWNQGVKSWEVMKKIAAPVPELALHIVGEAWSTNQGWVEGALETAEAVVGTMARIPREALERELPNAPRADFEYE
jgi:monoamine oxidase